METRKLYDASVSGDQSFSLNRVLRSKGANDHVIVLDTDDISESEAESVLSLVKAGWATWV